jgi:hypothetical protein
MISVPSGDYGSPDHPDARAGRAAPGINGRRSRDSGHASSSIPNRLKLSVHKQLNALV